jgi:hypothetical protein
MSRHFYSVLLTTRCNLNSFVELLDASYPCQNKSIIDIVLFWKALIITKPKTKPIKVVINNPTPTSEPLESLKSPPIDFSIMKAEIIISPAPINPSAMYMLVNTWSVAIWALVLVGSGVASIGDEPTKD